MSVDVRGLIGSPGEQREMTMIVPVPDYGPPGEEVRFQPADVRLVLTATPGGILAGAQISSVADLVCSRCLHRLSRAISAEFKHLFVLRTPAEKESGPSKDAADRRARDSGQTSLSHEDEDVPDTSPIIDGHIDVTPLVEEAAALALPMKPLCRADCLGLCPVCGHNLNAGPCGCTVDEPDPRLAGLRDYVAAQPGEPARAPGRGDRKQKEKDHGPTKT